MLPHEPRLSRVSQGRIDIIVGLRVDSREMVQEQRFSVVILNVEILVKSKTSTKIIEATFGRSGCS